MKIKFRLFYQDISWTFIAEAAVLISFFLTYRLIGDNFGTEGVGEYSLVKRVIGLLLPFLLLGLTIGIPRYIAMSHDQKQRSAYLKAGGLVVVAITIISLAIINVFKNYFAKLLLGTIDYANLVLPLSLLLAGLILHTLVYSYLRGRLFVKIFNSLQVVNIALVPIGIIVLFKDITIERIIMLTGITTFTIALIVSLIFIKELLVATGKGAFPNSLKELLCYSFPRFIASIVYAGLLSLGTIFAAHVASIQEVGYLSVSQSLLSAAGMPFAPLGLILLPKISVLIAQKRQEEIKDNLNYLMGATIQCAIFALVQLLIFTDTIIIYWLGPEFIAAVPVTRIILCSILAIFVTGTMGSILEASTVKPVNLINLCISLSVFLIISGVLLFLIKPFSPIISLSIAFTSGLICLGILTYVSIRKIYPQKLNRDLNYLGIAVGFNILLGGVAILTKSFTVSSLYYLVIFEVLIGIIYLLILWFLKVDWLRKIPEKIVEINKL